MNTTLLLPLFAILAIAIVFDLRARRIPSSVVTIGLALGLACQLYGAARGEGAALLGLWPALGGAVVGFVLMLPACLLRMVEPGDARLMATVGAFLGPGAAVGAVLFALLTGGVFSLAAALATRSLARVGQNMRAMFYTVVAGRVGALGMMDDDPATARLPYALAIACGTALQMLAMTNPRWMIR